MRRSRRRRVCPSTVTEVRWVSLADGPGGVETLESIEADVAARFLVELTRQRRQRLAEDLPELSWVVLGEAGPVAAVRAARLRWDGTPDGAPAAGAAEALGRAGEDGADTLAVLDVTVAAAARGHGVGRAVVAGLDERRRDHGLGRTLLLLRPHAKVAYPLIPFGRYASSVTGDGAPFDPWFRTAWQAGYRPVLGVDRSLEARADVAAWQRWLGLEVPGSGPYLVPGALKPAIVELERDEGRYREPHLWVGATGPPRPPADADWVTALAEAGVVAGDRSHREVRRERR